MLYYQRQGEGPDVVLVHGFLGSGRIFKPLTAHLARGFCVTTIDLPGFAGSYDAPVAPTVEGLSATVIETIRAIGIDKCSILGHSLGAWIALEASLQAPELLHSTVLYGGSPDGICPDRFET
ncbi:MAG: alpha/beta fold hydrolase [Gammaproteobacteria bacterium]|jgi:pimeloyl-ACP methyl ester carboxylesterase